jgi:hypothetical protein
MEFQALKNCGQFHKTFFGVIYAPSGVTRVETQGSMSKVALYEIGKFLTPGNSGGKIWIGQ